MERWKKALVALSIVGLLAALSGCGSGEGGESAPLSKVKFKAGGKSVLSITDKGGAHFDISTSGTGSGRGSTFVQSAYDSAGLECDFYLTAPGAYLPETDNKYEVQSGGNTLYEVVITSNYVNGYPPASCARDNACIECDVTKNGTNCSISCTGNVPSNYITNNTQFGIAYKGVGYLRTGYPNIAGADVTEEVFGFHANIDDWPEFQLTDTYSDFRVCTDGNILMNMGGLLADLLYYFTDATHIGDVYNFSYVDADQEKFFFINPQSGWLSAADTYNSGGVTQYECPVELKTVIPMTVQTMNSGIPGYNNDLSRGNINIGIGICDDYANPSCDLYDMLE